MWAYYVAVVRRSAPLSRVRASPTLSVAVSSSQDLPSSRSFSSEGGNRGGRGGGRGGQEGRGGSGRRDNNEPWEGRGRRPKKPNFSQQFLEPAARGELRKGHKSGIPKLAGRRPKGRGVRGADSLAAGDELDFLDLEEGPSVEFEYTAKKEQRKEKTERELKEEEYEKLREQLKYMVEEEKYYWEESGIAGNAKKEETWERLQMEATPDADGNLVVEVDDDIFDMFEGVEEKKTDKEEPEQYRKGQTPQADDIEFMMDALKIEGRDIPHGPDYDQAMPLDMEKYGGDIFTAMFHHPTKFGSIKMVNLHKESTREPVPDLPPQRLNPPKEFVEGNLRFIYVWGLPSLTVDGELGDLNNPVHCMEIQKTVGGLFDVGAEQVSVASLTSAFIGFKTVQDQRFRVAVGPTETVMLSPVTISKYAGDKELSFSKDSSPDSLVLLQNLPSGYSPSLLASILLQEGTEVGEIYGKNLNTEDIVMLSPNSAVLRLESAEMVESAVHSTMLHERLLEVGQHRIRYHKARRELVYTGKHGGPTGTDRLRALGPRLIVDGDMPSKAFYLSHAETIHLRNLDPAVTPQEIALFFQPFCAIPRDVEGSVELVTCENGLPTGKAFVGFDELGEAEEALNRLASGSGRMKGLGGNVVVVKMVKDSQKMFREKRQTRSEEALLESLHNWEQYVDPADVQELLSHGFSKESLDEAFRMIRYQNETFASLDQAMRSETLNPEKETGGMYKELVQEYILTLKECIATPENPGPIYESLFFEGEEMDTEIFENEAKRQEELRKRRDVP